MQCEASFTDDDVVILNGTDEDLPKMEGNMEARQAKLKAEKKAKSEAKQKEKASKKEAQASTSSPSMGAPSTSVPSPSALSAVNSATKNGTAEPKSLPGPSSSKLLPTASSSKLTDASKFQPKNGLFYLHL